MLCFFQKIYFLKCKDVSSLGSDNINLIHSFRHKKEVFYNEGGKTIKQVVQGSSDSPIPVNIQDQVG